MLWANFNNRFPRVAAMLGTAVRTGRTGHAYLFSGDNAPLLNESALAWAQVCACRNGEATGTPCGECRNCQLLERRAYPELYILRPQSKSRAIVVDRVRDFEHQLGLSTERGQIKIGLIEESDCMNVQAQNAFLKTLEEPPRRTLLLLTSTRPLRLLPTIRSRCQSVSLMENRREYPLALEADLPSILGELRPGGGARCALAAATALGELFSGLRKRAETEAQEDEDDQWQEAAESDAQLRKELEKESKARESARYLALRSQLVEAIETWGYQEMLRGTGVPAEQLPHPEMLGDGTAATAPPAPGPEAAERLFAAVKGFARVMNTNADESLAIHAFCLEVARKDHA